MNAMGIDIGTTTVSVVMMDAQDGAILGSRTVAHHSFLQGHIDQSKIQDPVRLFSWNVVLTGCGSGLTVLEAGTSAMTAV